MRGFQMEKGVDFDDSFSPTLGLAVGRFMLSLAVANDYELHACDIEQAFLQADKLPEGVNGRYFIQPPPGSPDANDDPPFFVLTETKFSFRCIPVWDRYSPHRTRVEKKHM